MRFPRMRFTVRRVMVAIAIVAVLMAIRGTQPFYPITSGLITTLGRRYVSSGGDFIEVYEQGDKLNYRVGRRYRFGSSVGGPAVAQIVKGTPWFAFVESANRIWIFDGDGVLTLYTFGPGTMMGGFEAGEVRDSAISPKIVEEAPKGVWDRLPQEFKDRFKVGSAARPG